MKVLIVSNNLPLESFYAAEGLELALTLASLEHTVSMLFLNNACLQLIKQPSDSSKSYQALHLYGITTYIEQTELLEQLTISIPAEIVTTTQINSLYEQHDWVMTT